MSNCRYYARQAIYPARDNICVFSVYKVYIYTMYTRLIVKGLNSNIHAIWKATCRVRIDWSISKAVVLYCHRLICLLICLFIWTSSLILLSDWNFQIDTMTCIVSRHIIRGVFSPNFLSNNSSTLSNLANSHALLMRCEGSKLLEIIT